jgi:hypothetical protein
VALQPLRSELDGQDVEASSREDTSSLSRWTGHLYTYIGAGQLLGGGGRGGGGMIQKFRGAGGEGGGGLAKIVDTIF